MVGIQPEPLVKNPEDVPHLSSGCSPVGVKLVDDEVEHVGGVFEPAPRGGEYLIFDVAHQHDVQHAVVCDQDVGGASCISHRLHISPPLKRGKKRCASVPATRVASELCRRSSVLNSASALSRCGLPDIGVQLVYRPNQNRCPGRLASSHARTRSLSSAWRSRDI